MLSRVVLVAVGASMLAACAGAPQGPASDMVTVSGTVTYLQRIALPPEAVVTVRLQDVSRMDVPAILIGEQRIALDGRQVPVPFEIGYDPAAIDERMSYAVSARIELGDQLLMISDTVHPVITREAPTTDVEIRVVPVRR